MLVQSRRYGTEKVKSPPRAAAAAFPVRQRFLGCLASCCCSCFWMGTRRSTEQTGKDIRVSVRHSVRKLQVTGFCSVALGDREQAGRTTSLLRYFDLKTVYFFGPSTALHICLDHLDYLRWLGMKNYTATFCLGVSVPQITKNRYVQERGLWRLRPLWC